MISNKQIHIDEPFDLNKHEVINGTFATKPTSLVIKYQLDVLESRIAKIEHTNQHHKENEHCTKGETVYPITKCIDVNTKFPHIVNQDREEKSSKIKCVNQNIVIEKLNPLLKVVSKSKGYIDEFGNIQQGIDYRKHE